MSANFENENASNSDSNSLLDTPDFMNSANYFQCYTHNHDLWLVRFCSEPNTPFKLK